MSGHQYDNRPIGLDALHDEEVQTTAVSGGKKGVKLTQVGALDPVAIMEVARVAGYGANKYAAFNYLQGFEYSKAYNAMMRHLNLFWAGEDIDPESGRLHLGHAAIEAMFLISFYLRGIGTDDRPPRLDGDPVSPFKLANPLMCDELPECGEGVHADACAISKEIAAWRKAWDEMPPPAINVMPAPPTVVIDEVGIRFDPGASHPVLMHGDEAPRERCQHLWDNGVICGLMREANIHRAASEHLIGGVPCSLPSEHHVFVRPT